MHRPTVVVIGEDRGGADHICARYKVFAGHPNQPSTWPHRP